MVFPLLCLEFGFFLFHDMISRTNLLALIIVSFIMLGGSIGGYVYNLAFPEEESDEKKDKKETNNQLFGIKYI